MIDRPGILDAQPGTSLNLIGAGLTGRTTNADLFNPPPLVTFVQSSSVQQLEVMSQDLGNTSAGFFRNFAYDTLQVGTSSRTTVKLVDNAHNAPGTGPEALYVNTLIVMQGSTLDLNGLHVYARTAQIAGTVLDGFVSIVPPGGAIPLNAQAPGDLSASGQVDDWTFYGRAGQSVAVIVHTGAGGIPVPPAPDLNWAQVALLDPNGQILATASNSQSGADAAIAPLTLPADGTYHIHVQAPASQPGSTGNYVLSTYGSPIHDSSLTLNQPENGQLDTPVSEDRWEFTAVANEQVEFHLIAAANSDIQFDLTGPGGFAGFTGLTADSPPVVLPAAGGYTLTALVAGDAAGAYSFRMESSPIALTLGTPFHEPLAGSGQTQLYRVQVATASPLLVDLADGAAGDQNEVYVKLGAPPTRADYDYRYSGSVSANQVVTVPQAAPGTWYILVYNALVPASGSYTLTAVASSLFLETVSPPELGTTHDATLGLTGAGFDGTTTVDLVAANGTALPADSVQIISSTSLTATFRAGTVPAGVYSVAIAKAGGGSSELPNAFTLVQGGQGHLQTSLVVPSRLAVGRAPAVIEVEYSNTGTDAMPAPLLFLTATQGSTQAAFLTLDPSLMQSGLWSTGTRDGFNSSVQFLASGAIPGLLQPGESIHVPVYWAGWQVSEFDLNAPIDFQLSSDSSDDTRTVDWSALRDSLRPSTIAPDAWNALYPNLVTQLGSTWGQYVARMDVDSTYLASLGENVTDLSQLFEFEIRLANGFSPVSTVVSATDMTVPAPGLSLAVDRVSTNSIIGRNQMGPFGQGWWWADGWQRTLSVQGDGTVMIADGDGSQRRFEPDSRGGYFDQPGDHATLTKLNNGGYALTETNGVTTAFRSDGNVDYLQDTNGNRITAGYTNGLLTSLTHSSGQSLQIAYDGGRIKTITDPASGRVTAYTYDASDEHLLTVTTFDQRTTTYAYDTGSNPATLGALLSVAHSDDTHEFFAYDAQGRLEDTHLDGDAEDVAYSYGPTGAATATDAAGGATTYSFDVQGMIAKVDDPLGRDTLFSYCSCGSLTQATDPAGQSYHYNYDSNGNLIRATDPLGHAVTFGHAGPFSRLTSSTDQDGNTTQYGYDSNGNQISTTYADGSVERVAYDAVGDPMTVTNRRGDPINYQYDTSGRVTSETFADGTQMTYHYDGRGNLSWTTDPSGTMKLTYDSIDQLKEIDYPGGLFLKYSYDAAGRRTQMVDQTGFTVNYSYDAVGRLSKLTDGTGALIDQYTYDAAGRLEREDKGNGTYTTYEYDLAGNLLHLVNHAPDGSVNSRFDYTYDALGRRATETTLDGRWTYTYDAIGELTHAVFAPNDLSAISNQDLQYFYDPAGNRTQTIINGVTTAYVSNNLNQYTSVGSQILAYDADGNLVSQADGAATTTYGYDEVNRLTSVVTPSGGTWSHQYDAVGNRTGTTHNGQRTIYSIDPFGLSTVVGEYNDTESVIAHYVQGLGLTQRVDSNGMATEYDFDGIGSTVGLSGQAGNYVDSYSYLPFGESQTVNNPVPNPFTFIGFWGAATEDNGLSLMGQRFYDGNSGRFLSNDPLGIRGDGPDLYTYADNNPLTRIDPQGLFSIWDYVSTIDVGVSGGYWGGGSTGLRFGRDTTCFYLGGGFSTPGFGGGVQFSGSAPSPGWELQGAGAVGGAVGGGVSLSMSLSTGSLSWSAGPGGGLGGSKVLGASLLLIHSWCTTPRTKPPDPCSGCEPGGGGGSQPARPADPNDAIGPGGYGPAGFIAPGGPLPYRIDFENEATATAPAQRVVVTDPLDPSLNWTTFALTEVGFGNTDIAIPPGTQHFQTTVDTTENRQPIQVDIDLGFNPQTGLVTATFQTIDPRTQLPPDVLTGFLPPEDGTGRGKGYFTYVVAPKVGLPTGTQIRNIASVVFDVNAPITTDQVDDNDPSKGVDPAKQDLITIDAGPPSSHVAPLPATETSAHFTVSWSGQDDLGGSGIASYDVYVSDNAGPFVPFVTSTTQSSATFQGVNGHTYAFFSVATDNVGNVQATPASAQASTKVAVSTSTGSPHVGPIVTPIRAVRAGASAAASASFSEIPANGPHTAIWSWGDGKTTAGKVTEPKGSGTGTIAGSHIYAGPGLYRVTLTVTDAHKRAGKATAAQTVVVYNPSAGSITGNGTITSPRGAVPSSPKLTGKATFQLSAKYASARTVPSGTLVMTFQAAHLSFQSTSLDWLVLSGSTAWYQGTGTVNGAGSFRFLVSAQGGGHGTGKLRIRIWNKATGAILYDSQPGAPIQAAPTTTITGGSIAFQLPNPRKRHQTVAALSVAIPGLRRRGAGEPT